MNQTRTVFRLLVVENGKVENSLIEDSDAGLGNLDVAWTKVFRACNFEGLEVPHLRATFLGQDRNH